MLPTWPINLKADQLDTPCHSSKKMNNKKVLIIVGIIILVVGSGFGIWWFRRDTSEFDEFGLTRLDNELNEEVDG